MLLLKRGNLEVEAGSAAVTAAEAGEIARAGEVLAAAEAEAGRMLETAKAEAAAEKARGYREGIAAGKAEILQQKIDLVDESVRYMESIELKVADIVLKALRKCVEEIGEREAVVRIVRKAIGAVVRNQRQLTVKVHPSVLEAVRGRAAAIAAEFPSLAFIDVRDDAHLAADACVVETEAGIVEASVAGQLQAIENSIRRNFTKGA